VLVSGLWGKSGSLRGLQLCHGLGSSAIGLGMKNNTRKNVEVKISGGVRRSGGDAYNLRCSEISLAEDIER
jgi:hypothetical protein